MVNELVISFHKRKHLKSQSIAYLLFVWHLQASARSTSGPDQMNSIIRWRKALYFYFEASHPLSFSTRDPSYYGGTDWLTFHTAALSLVSIRVLTKPIGRQIDGCRSFVPKCVSLNEINVKCLLHFHRIYYWIQVSEFPERDCTVQKIN